MVSLRSAVAGTILVVGLYFGPMYAPEEFDRISYHSQVTMEREPLVWDLQSPALDLASALTSAASATSLIS